MSFSEQIVYALTKPSEYKELIKLKTSRFVAFVIVICLFLGVMTFLVPVGTEISEFNGFTNLFNKRMGEVSATNGILHVEENVDVCLDSTYILFGDRTHILIDTDFASIPDSLFQEDGFYWAVGSMYVRNVYVYNHEIYNESTFTMNLPEGFNNQMLESAIPGIYIGIIIMFVILSVSYFIKYAFFALVLSFLINSVNHQLNLGMTNGQVFQLCFYGESLGMLISNFNNAAGLLDSFIVSIITVFISIHFITKAVVLMNRRNQV